MNFNFKTDFRSFNRKFLNPFVEVVHDGKYHKMDYQTWRILTRFNENEVIDVHCKSGGVEIFAKGLSWEFPYWDNGFGSFIKKLFDAGMIDNKAKIENDKENKDMKNVVNFDFGPCTGSDNIRMSLYGIAVKNASGTFVSYDAANASIMDVEIFNFDGAKFLYKMPVAIKDIRVGDVVIHARKPMFVTEVLADAKSLKVVDPVSGEKKEILLTRSPFGFDFATKIVNFIGNIGGNSAANADNPFGNLWMFMLMNDNGNTDNLLPLMLMNQSGGSIDPMMMFALAGGKDSENWLPFLMMSSMNKNNTCACNCHCGDTEAH